MHTIKKLYCRTYQTAFKAALPFLPYRKPQIVPHVSDLPELLSKRCCRRVLIVTDGGLRKLGMTETLEKDLEKNGIGCAVYDRTCANPTSANVEEAAALYRETGCDAIVGFGGGSSIDCAKAVGARIAKPHQPLSKMKGVLKVRRRIPPLAAIPTTAGTGSETTLAAVITDSVTRHKYTINDFPLIPRYAVLDPEVTRSLPPFITATTGMDALTHAVEAYIGNSTVRSTRRAALKAVQLIFANLDRAVADHDTPHDEAARRFIDAIKEMKKRFGIGDTIPQLCAGDIPKLARYADREANPLYPVPRLMDASELAQFYELLLESD